MTSSFKNGISLSENPANYKSYQLIQFSHWRLILSKKYSSKFAFEIENFMPRGFFFEIRKRIFSKRK